MHSSCMCLEYNQRLTCRILLAWFSSFLSGVYVGMSVPDSYFLLMRASLTESVSIVWLLIVNFLPLTLLAISIRLETSVILYPLCAIKALIFGASLACIGGAFGNAAWLIYLIMFIPAFFDCAVFLYFMIRNLRLDRIHYISDVALAFIMLFSTAFADYLVFSPFINGLLN